MLIVRIDWRASSLASCDAPGSAAGPILSTIMPTAFGKMRDVAEETTSATAAPASRGSSGLAALKIRLSVCL
jgi:hypothetical protein